MTVFAKIKIMLVALAVAVIIGWLLYTIHIKSDRDRLMLEASTARQALQEVSDTLERERATWKVATLAFSTASQVQGAACRADMERRAQIDEISRECVVIVTPEGSIDEQTSSKVIDMFNGSLFAPLGGRVRTEAN